MIYLSPLSPDPETLKEQIASLEGQRERKRALGRLSSAEAQRIAQELRELRSAYAVVSVQKAVSHDKA